MVDALVDIEPDDAGMEEWGRFKPEYPSVFHSFADDVVLLKVTAGRLDLRG